MEQVVIEYVPEKAELEDGMDEFRNVFEKFNFLQSAGSEVKGLVFLFYPFLFWQFMHYHFMIFLLTRTVIWILCSLNSNRRMIKRMNQSKMQMPRRKPTQIQIQKKKKIMNKRRKACQTKRKRFAFIAMQYYCCWLFCINRMNSGYPITEWWFFSSFNGGWKLLIWNRYAPDLMLSRCYCFFNVSVVYYFSVLCLVIT